MMLTVPSIFKQPARAYGADDDKAHLRVLDPVLSTDHSKQPLLGSLLTSAEARIADFTEKVQPRRAIDVVKEDPSDNRILP